MTRLRGMASLHIPVDPEKPLSRSLRRVLLVLSKGGTLERVPTKDNRPGYRHLPDPSGRCYYTLRPDTKHRRFHSRKTMKERTVLAATVDHLVTEGYLLTFAKVATAEHLTAAGREIVKATDWNGNLKGDLP